MNSSLTVESTRGAGSTFIIELPQAQTASAQHSDVEAEDGGALRVQSRGGNRRHTVLYIEDNPANLSLIEHLFANRNDIQLLSAPQGRFGIEVAREHRPALILLDLGLPDMPGEEVFQRLRDDEKTRGIPVIVISADATPYQQQRLLGLGAREYLTKPFEVNRFFEVIEEALPGSHRRLREQAGAA